MNQAYYALVSLSAFFNSKFDRKDRGATAVEYGLMVGLIAVVIIAAVVVLGGTLEGLLGDVNNGIAAETGGETYDPA